MRNQIRREKDDEKRRENERRREDEEGRRRDDEELSNSAATENSFVKKNERKSSPNAFLKATVFILIFLKNFAYSVGEICLSMARFFTGNAKIRCKEFWLIIQEVGINAHQLCH